jgi:serine/threonine protein kinase
MSIHTRPWRTTDSLGNKALGSLVHYASERKEKTEPARHIVHQHGDQMLFDNTTTSRKFDKSPKLAMAYCDAPGSASPKWLVSEDPESDVASASGRSMSLASTPSHGSVEAEFYPSVHVDTAIEATRNTMYCSRMRLSQFQRLQTRANWVSFVQELRDNLPANIRQQNDRYQLVDYGGSSTVWAAAFTSHGSMDTLAIKVLHRDTTSSEAELPSELRIMQGLRHNHIVAFVGSFVRQEQFCVILYPLAVCNLAQYLKETTDINLKKYHPHEQRQLILLTALGCLTSAVMYFHITENIKHKDIKPENILVDKFGAVHLADFGISKKYHADNVTSGQTPFTERYAPPEVVKQGTRGLSSDIFSLGCVFLEMATVILGESLGSLGEMVFAQGGVERKSYYQSVFGVGKWINHLKTKATEHTLSAQHLDAIHRMISCKPEDRPDIEYLHELFQNFAKDCCECQAESSPLPLIGGKHHLSELCAEENVTVAQDETFITQVPMFDTAWREPEGYTGKIPPQSSYSSPSLHVSWTKQGRATPQRGNLEMTETHPKLNLNGEDIDLASEDSDLSDDFDLIDEDSDRESAVLFRQIMASVHEFLRKMKFKDWITYFHQCPDFHQCSPGSSSTGTSCGFTTQERSAKRRLTGRPSQYQRPDQDSDSDADNNPPGAARNGRGNTSTGLQQPRPFACPFFRRHSNRCTNRACAGPGWRELHRLK